MRILGLCLLLIGCGGSTPDQTTASPSPPPNDSATATAPPTESPNPTAEPPDQNAGNVTISSPADGSVVQSNPVEASGTARTFENNVVLEVVASNGEQLVQTSTTARGELGNFNPWSEELWLTEWPGSSFTIRAIEHSARDGSVRSQASVTVESAMEPREVTLYFPNTKRSPNDCSQVYPVTRTVPNTVAMAELLTRALMDGPNAAQRADGFSSGFPRGARLQSVALTGGVLTLDFSPEMQNVGGSCRVQSIRASLERTLTQLENVGRVRITAGGSEELALQP